LSYFLFVENRKHGQVRLLNQEKKVEIGFGLSSGDKSGQDFSSSVDPLVELVPD
jgi:hypothetical protein